MRLVKFLLLALGVYVLYATIQSVGWQVITNNIRGLGWQLVPLMAIYPVIFALDTLGWLCAFPKSLPRVPFGELYFIRIIGETLNCVIPWAASLGGEPVKVQLLKVRHGIPASEGFASILIVHTTFWISLNIFVIGGIAVSFETLPLTPVLWQSVLAFLVGLGLIAILLIIGLHFGIFKKVHKLGESFKWWGDQSQAKKIKFLELDNDIKRFYTANPMRFISSVLFNFGGWFVGAFEVFWIGKMLGMDITFSDAWLLEALFQVLRIVTFFIPSSIGTQEGGIVLIFLQFGFDKTLGVTFAVIRRLREVVWIGFGLFLWAVMEDRPKIPKIG